MKLTRRSLLFSIASSALLLSSCGDSFVDEVSGAPAGARPVVVGQRFLGTGSAGGETFEFQLDVSDSGAASGSFRVLTSAQGLPSSGSLTGVASVEQGIFFLYNADRSILISGSLPGQAEAGSFVLSLLGALYPGVLANESDGYPEPPASSRGEVIHNFLLFSKFTEFNFRVGRDYNGSDPVFPSLNTLEFLGVVHEGSQAGNVIWMIVHEQSGTQPEMIFTVIVPLDQPLEAGQTYPVTNSQEGANLELRDAGAKYWSTLEQGSGSLTITSYTDSGMNFDFSFVGVGPDQGSSPNNAAGLFECDGSFQGPFLY